MIVLSFLWFKKQEQGGRNSFSMKVFPGITVWNHNVNGFRIIRSLRGMKWVECRVSLLAGLWRHGISTSQGKGNANWISSHASFKWALIIQYHFHWIENPVLKNIGMCKCVCERAGRDRDKGRGRERIHLHVVMLAFSHLVLSSNSRVVRDMKLSAQATVATWFQNVVCSPCCSYRPWLFFVCLFVLVANKVSLSSHGYPGTSSVDETDLCLLAECWN